MSQRCFMIVAAWSLFLSAATASAQQAALGVSGDITASIFQGQIGQRLSFVCPAGSGTGKIWGTDVYTIDSAICTAAVHAGVLTTGQPGVVTILIGSGAEAFPGALRNGVTSQSYGKWGSSFTLDRSGEPGQIGWGTTGQYVPAGFTDPIKVTCPPLDTTAPRIWGTDTYTDDSSVCFAAVHTGAISPDVGGKISVSRVAGQASYAASARNGVTSSSWGAWTGSFNVVATPVGTTFRVPTTPATTTEPGTGSCPPGTTGTTCTSITANTHTLTLAGFTASGTSVAVVPHTLTLAGFTGSGISTAATPHTMTLVGWTGHGLIDKQPKRRR